MFMMMMLIFITILFFIFAFGAKIGSKTVMYIGYFIGELVCFVSTIACSVVLIILTAYADICMNPAKNIGGVAGSNVQDMMVYFSQCTAEDPFQGYLTTLEDSLDAARSDVETFGNDCKSDGSITSNYDAITDAVGDVKKETSCISLHEIYDTFFNDAVCNNSFDGVYKIWLIAFVCTICLFFILVSSCIIWQYFDVPGAWKLRPRDTHTGTHQQLTGTAFAAPLAHAQYEPVARNMKQEYTFTAASPSTPALTRREIEMI